MQNKDLKTRIIAITSAKYMSGKTTAAVTLADMLAILGKRVLLIDMDPQGDATSIMAGINYKEKHYNRDGSQIYRKGTYELFMEDSDIHELIRESPHGCREVGMILDYIPAGDNLSNLNGELVKQAEKAKTLGFIINSLVKNQSKDNAENPDPSNETAAKVIIEILQRDETKLPERLKTAAITDDFDELENDKILKARLASLNDEYDYIILDLNTEQNLVLKNAIVAATDVITVSSLDRFALEGTVGMIEKFKRHNPGTKNIDILINQSETVINYGLKREILSYIEGNYPVCEIKYDNAIINANINLTPVFGDSGRSIAGTDYIHAAYNFSLISKKERDKILKVYALES